MLEGGFVAGARSGSPVAAGRMDGVEPPLRIDEVDFVAEDDDRMVAFELRLHDSGGHQLERHVVRPYGGGVAVRGGERADAV